MTSRPPHRPKVLAGAEARCKSREQEFPCRSMRREGSRRLGVELLGGGTHPIGRFGAAHRRNDQRRGVS